MRSRLACAAGLAVALTSGACDNGPALVYVPDGPPNVTVQTRVAVADVEVGAPIVLHATRTSRGRWRQVRRAELSGDTCWLAQPPPAEEPEVADNLQWTAAPATARFNVDLREDHTRAVTFAAAGTVVLSATSPVWCGSPVAAAPLPIVVRATP